MFVGRGYMARRFLGAKVANSAAGFSCGEYASGDGEGKFRSDPKTHLFTSRTNRFKIDRGDEYARKVGPGSYTPQDAVRCRLLYHPRRSLSFSMIRPRRIMDVPCMR